MTRIVPGIVLCVLLLIASVLSVGWTGWSEDGDGDRVEETTDL